MLHIDRNIDLVSLNRLKCKNGANRSDSRPSTPLSRVIKTNRRPSEVGLCYLTGDALAPRVCLPCSTNLTQSYPGSPLLPEEGQWLPAGSSFSPLKGNSGVNTYKASHKLLGDVSWPWSFSQSIPKIPWSVFPTPASSQLLGQQQAHGRYQACFCWHTFPLAAPLSEMCFLSWTAHRSLSHPTQWRLLHRLLQGSCSPPIILFPFVLFLLSCGLQKDRLLLLSSRLRLWPVSYTLAPSVPRKAAGSK